MKKNNYTKILGGLFTLALVFCFSAGYGQALKVASTGNVGVNTPNPLDNFHVTGVMRFSGTSSAEGGQMSYMDADDSGGWEVDNFGVANNEILRIFRDKGASNVDNLFRLTHFGGGQVLIGNTYSSEKLVVDGDIFITGQYKPSDERLKKKVSNFNYGLEEVLKLNTVKYQYNGKANLSADKNNVGVMAQEMKKITPTLVEPWIYEERSKETNEVISSTKYLKINEGAIKYMLINAIKDQQSLIDDQNQRIEKLESKIESIIELFSENETIIESTSLSNSKLGYIKQNKPNPFETNTVIEYSIPEDSKAASIQFYDLSGKILKTVNLDIKSNSLEVNTDDLPGGVYSYHLIIDNQILDSYKMVKID